MKVSYTVRLRLAKACSDLEQRAGKPLTGLIPRAPRCQPGLGPDGVRFA